MKTNHITQQHIAEKLKVSRITVSKALRDHPDISAKMKEKVKNAVEEMGYIPNLIAKQLTLRKTFTLGIVIPDLENSFFAYLVDSIIDAATERNYHIILSVSREKEAFEKNNVMNLIGMRVDGLLVCVSQETSDRKIFEYVRKVRIPLVFFDRAITSLGFSYVSFDDMTGTLKALKQLISNGYQRIAHFAGYSYTSIGSERCKGYRKALTDNGISINDEWIIEGGYEIDDGIRSFEKLRKTGKMPEIILAVNDRVASGAYKAIRKAGLRIPEDIGIIGYGFSETAHLFSPTLSIINQDPRKMGKLAADMLIDKIQGISADSSEILIEEDFQWNTSIIRRK
ncbi:MAG TPA: LacI family DNA-binding transcriptional regulator [Bacteroidales bacterium]|nr:LacI family DNA-binding transcriptional regulator [Bacteroidales bacterium]